MGIAATSKENGTIQIFAPTTQSELPRNTIDVHRAQVTQLKYNEKYDCCISVDIKGIMDYWNVEDGKLPSCVTFSSKFDCDILKFMMTKSQVLSLEISPDGEKFATLSSDHKMRVWDFRSAKVLFELDESFSFYESEQMKEGSMFKVESLIYGKKLATEKEVRAEIAKNPYMYNSQIVWGSTGYFLMYPTLLGIKVVNVVTEQVVRLIGNGETNARVLNIALFQGIPRAVSETEAEVINRLALTDTSVKVKVEDPTLFATAFQSDRFHLITNREPDLEDTGTGRDKLNEKPTFLSKRMISQSVQQSLGKAAIIHTDYGDIHIKPFGREAPKAVENFTTHAENNYFNGMKFHRVVENFMIQTGDP